MNLHISTPSAHIRSFANHLSALGWSDNNRIVLRKPLQDTGFAAAELYTSGFEDLVGDPREYDNVFIHQFSPMLYRWVASHEFKKLNWMVWGADLYNLPGHEYDLFEPLTSALVKSHRTIGDRLYGFKARMQTWRYQHQALSKVDNILTWMNSEYDWAIRHLPALRAEHQYFFYHNKYAYEYVAECAVRSMRRINPEPVLMLGNSGTPSNNHLDTLEYLREIGFSGELIVPLSYGSDHYIRKLKSSLQLPGCKVSFLEQYMPFEEYLSLMAGTDGLIMNTLRPQGYGNIFMMMMLGKKVFLNPMNPSCADLDRMQIKYHRMDELRNFRELNAGQDASQQHQILSFFSENRLKEVYKSLFA